VPDAVSGSVASRRRTLCDDHGHPVASGPVLRVDPEIPERDDPMSQPGQSRSRERS